MPVLAALQSTFADSSSLGVFEAKLPKPILSLVVPQSRVSNGKHLFEPFHQAVDPCANQFEFNLTMLSVYFDTNVYDQIDKGKLSSADLEALRLAFNDGGLIGHLGIPNIEELMGQWKTDRAAAVRKVALARDLVGFSRVLKPPNVLMEEAIRAYSGGSSPPSPFLPEGQDEVVASHLNRIANGGASLDGTLLGIVGQVGVLKQTALDQWTEGRREVHSALSPYSVEARHPQRTDIRWWLKSEELAYAEGLAKSLGVDDACTSRGLAGLLKIRVVRVYVNSLAAYIFDITIGREAEPRAPKWGDNYDFWHIISASTADVFVTYDTRLVGLLNRLPIEGFSVYPSIPALLDAIVAPKY
jgi:hypothetical protein